MKQLSATAALKSYRESVRRYRLAAKKANETNEALERARARHADAQCAEVEARVNHESTRAALVDAVWREAAP